MFRAIKDYFRRRQLARLGITCQLSLKTLSAGDRSGVWTVLPELLKRDSIVYSFGVGDNLAWELALIDQFDLTVHAFDPTPPSVAWVAQQTLPPGLKFHATGLGNHDCMVRFAPRRPESRFNYRPLSATDTSSTATVEAPVCRLATLMERLGHDHIDIVKMDIEGGEYSVIDDMLKSRIRVKQLLVEFHHHFPGVGIGATEQAVKSLAKAGFQIFHISERGLEISFLHGSATDAN